MKNIMTDNQYVACEGSKCPFCKSTDLEHTNAVIERDEGWQDVECMECHAIWENHFILNGFI